jgi:hypothetical protein
MSDHIFTVKKETDAEQFYCLFGLEDFIDAEGCPRIRDADSPQISAKKIQNKKPKHFNSTSQYFRYYIKCDPNNKLFNPIKIYSSVSNKPKSKFVDKVCKSEWSFKEVDKFIFDKYIQFLLTKNISWLKEAERDSK